MAGQAQPDHAGLRPPRILILSASIGAGHDLPAEVMAAELRDTVPGIAVEVEDALQQVGPLLRAAVGSGSEFESALGNRIFDLEHRLVMQRTRPRTLLSAATLKLAAKPIGSFVDQRRPDVVVSTWPGATEVLGGLRATGRLDVPVVSAITDLASLWWWAHPGVDLHLITHPESAAEVRAIAGPDTEVVAARGMNDPRWAVPLGRDEARDALGLPPGRTVVVSGGGWGVGDLAGAVDEALTRDVHVVVLCGSNEALRTRMAARGDVDAWGFTDRMPELFAAADALIHSTAGLTMLEALMRGLPAISYGWGLGHIRLNNEAYARFGLAQVATDRAALGAALDRALASRPGPDLSFAALPTAAEVVLRRFCTDDVLDAA
ncbi:MAG: MGDG synthase family glycosyltransferase [Solirubrobacteraceae bacterium]